MGFNKVEANVYIPFLVVQAIDKSKKGHTYQLLNWQRPLMSDIPPLKSPLASLHYCTWEPLIPTSSILVQASWKHIQSNQNPCLVAALPLAYFFFNFFSFLFSLIFTLVNNENPVIIYVLKPHITSTKKRKNLLHKWIMIKVS